MNSLKRSRKKVDAEIMYEMRRQGMTNKQIAENLGVAVSTVYRTIGLSAKTLWVIRNDINEAAKFDGLGDPNIDAPQWLGLREMVQKELVKRGKAN